jgi:UDP-N-acetylmuramate dehydrogenase
MQIQKNILLSQFTTFGIGGPARFFARVKTVEELKETLDYARDQHLHTQILGGGSNILCADEGFDGLVIKVEMRGVDFNGEEVIAAAGESWDGLVEKCVNKNLWGLENLSGIPGTVGGAVSGSIGAYGQAVAQRVEWVEALDVASGEVKRLSNAECQFGYRESILSSAPSPLIIIRAAFKLSTVPKPELSYKDLAERFAGRDANLTEIRHTVIEIRKNKFPDLKKEGTAGSFFKNPVLPEAEARTLAEKFPGLPLFDMPEVPGCVKVPLAWLMDHALKLHGTQVGRARLFENQILVIVAKQNSRARDVRALAEFVKEKLRTDIGLEISPEVKIF